MSESLAVKVVDLLRAKKRLAELEILAEIAKEEKKEMLFRELEEVKAQLADLEKSVGPLVLPFSHKFDELNKRIGAFPKSEVIRALREKQGELYNLLLERGKLVKLYTSRAFEIGLLQEYLRAFPNPNLAECVRKGKLEGMQVEKAEWLARVLNRLGLFCKLSEGQLVPAESNEFEDEVEWNGELFWAKKGYGEKLREVLQELEEVKRRIQLLNAESQISEFNEQEEKEFRDLQAKYLQLLKNREELTVSLPSLSE